MDALDWIGRELRPEVCTSDRFLFDDLESQSLRCLPIIYEPFDGSKAYHWRDRGAAFDYVHATGGEGRRLLDFGPGDGWPSLIVAPYAAEVVGADGSRRRVDVCTENAHRLRLANTRFVHVPPGARLPFDDDTFDGAMAATSIEQTPDPKAALAELFRVLRPGGRLRLSYEDLNRYRTSEGREITMIEISDRRVRLILFDRDVDAETVTQYGLTLNMDEDALTRIAGASGRGLRFEDVSVSFLEEVRSAVVDARVCTTCHPGGRTLERWLRDAGFREVTGTRSGADAAGELFESVRPHARPTDLDAVDRLVRPVAARAVKTPVPTETDPMITARR